MIKWVKNYCNNKVDVCSHEWFWIEDDLTEDERAIIVCSSLIYGQEMITSLRSRYYPRSADKMCCNCGKIVRDFSNAMRKEITKIKKIHAMAEAKGVKLINADKAITNTDDATKLCNT